MLPDPEFSGKLAAWKDAGIHRPAELSFGILQRPGEFRELHVADHE